jgi:hypothetical protein
MMIYPTNFRGIDTSEASSLLPTQFFPNTQTEDEPLRRLMLAILLDAVRCYQLNFRSQQPHRRVDFDEAQQWLYRDSPLAPFSLVNVYSVLNIEPETVRNAIVRWTRQRATRKLDNSSVLQSPRTVVRRNVRSFCSN